MANEAELDVATKLRNKAKAEMEKADAAIAKVVVPQELLDALKAAREAVSAAVPANLHNAKGKAKAAFLLWDQAVVGFGGATAVTASKPGRKPAA